MEEDEWDDAMLSEIAALESRHLQGHGDASTAGNPPPNKDQDQDQVWSCRSCTLQNDGARATCLVCSTPRGRTFSTDASTSDSSAAAAAARGKKTVQATLSFGGGSAPVVVPSSQRQEQDDGRVTPSPFRSPERTGRNSTQQSVLAGPRAGTGIGLELTTRRSGRTHGAAGGVLGSVDLSPAEKIIRHAVGEDGQAKTRYLDIIARSNFPQIDYEKAQHFVYPTNYSIRDYQLTIAEKALYHNTLVSLPTGLGKTLIAAVVMYNFYRWFPSGKIVFMAPTKPLVAQQIRACHEIMGIPLSDTAELQGNVPPAMRRVLWSSKRVFFCTPQSLQNDLRRGVCAAEKFVCIVVDEAHRATGNYAYCCVVQEIEAKTNFFRVLALSATPGAKFDVIQDVVTNLRISHIESRSADDSDVKKYTHARQEEVIVCRLGAQILEVKALFLKCFTPIVQRLLRGNIIQYGDPEKLSSWYVLQARDRFRKSPSYASNRSAESDLALLVSLLHAKSLLTGHGLSSFRDQITNWIEDRKANKMSWSKRELLQSPEFQALELGLAVTPGASTSTNAASHPKLVKLREVLLEHFQRHAAAKSSTRAIVFTQYRVSVSEIVALLRQLAPLLNVQPFIGQGASGKAKENKGQSQKVQQDIVHRFRLGEFNVLVATCIAEEGLDIGEVDLIVSFDALTSPVRMIQRMGRTGRKRVGRVIILVTEGDEEKKLARSASAAKTVSRALTTFKSRFTYSKCPRMLPTGICPQLSELEMKIPTFHASQVGGKNASGAVDPSLWQLNDAERTEAESKYFPPNFALSKRNKLFPIVGNQRHLLRRRLHGQRRIGRLLVGYSTRSLILQRLVRKIHGIESDSDKEEDKTDGIQNNAGVVRLERDSVAQSSKDTSVEETHFSISSGSKVHRRLRTATDDADTESDIGSPWRKADTPSPRKDLDRGDDYFAAMDESVASLDMHFSPQFAESATEFAPAKDEDVDDRNDGYKRHQEHSGLGSTSKKLKTAATDPKETCPPSKINTETMADDKCTQSVYSLRDVVGGVYLEVKDDKEGEKPRLSGAMSLTLSAESPRPASSSYPQRVDIEGVRTQNDPQVAGTMSLTMSAESPRSRPSKYPSGDQQDECEDHENQVNPQPLSGALSLTLSAESAHSMPGSIVARQTPVIGVNESTRESSTTSRPRSTRQLQFGEIEFANKSLEQAGNTEISRGSATGLLSAASATVGVTNPKVEAMNVEGEELPAFSFALLPPDGNGRSIAGDAEGGSSDGEEPKEETSAYSFALLPPLNTEPSLKLEKEAPKKKSLGTGANQVEETNRSKPTAHIGKKSDCDGGKNASIVDLTKEDGATIVKSNRKATQDATSRTADPLAVMQTGQLQARSQPWETEPEQEEEDEEGCCSVCRESESFEDDPIIFCDGCNVAVHQFCYGIRAVPSDKWFCDVCTEAKTGIKGRSNQPHCQLCPLRGGAFKRTKCGRWVHVLCFLWIPELHVEQGDDDVLVLGALSRLDPDRKTLDCSLCHSNKGKGIIQCSHKRCLVAFHVSCASYAQYRMDQLDQPEGEASESGTLFLAYCPIHRKSKTPYIAPKLQKKPPSEMARSPRPCKPQTTTTAISSPSHLLTSPSSAEAKKKFKCFRRLKRKYDASQSHLFSQPGSSESPALTSPWQKRIRRSKLRRETARVLAAAYIEDIAEVRGGKDGDDDEDDYRDDYKDGADDSFINDSSQLLYSQSVVSPEDADSNSTTKKRRKTSPDMRAIYARSLFESQNSPLLLRRGGRHLGALPSQGIIRACLDEMHNGRGELDTTPSPRTRSRSRKRQEMKHATVTSPASTVCSAVAEMSGCVDEAASNTALPNFNLLGDSEPLENAETTTTRVGTLDANAVSNTSAEVDPSVAPPSFNLFGTTTPLPTIQENDTPTAVGFIRASSMMTNAGSHKLKPSTSDAPKATVIVADQANDTSNNDLLKKIEAKRLVALEKLQQRRQVQPQQDQELSSNTSSTNTVQMDNGHTVASRAIVFDGSSSAGDVSSEVHDIAAAPSFNLLSLVNSGGLPAQDTSHAATATVDLTNQPSHPEANLQCLQQKHQLRLHTFTIFVSSTFTGSSSFPLLKASKRNGCSVDVEGSLEADILLSVRMAVLLVTSNELHALALTAPAQKVLKHPRVRTLLVMHKKLVLAVIHEGGDTSEMQRLRKLPNVMVIVQPRVESLCAQLHDIAHQELAEGYELPFPSMYGYSDSCSESSQGLDAEFSSRLAFFRTIPALSLGTALSLSFRFKNFAAAQVPVHKFNEMHWRRMLPWISERTATDIRKYIEHNVPQS